MLGSLLRGVWASCFCPGLRQAFLSKAAAKWVICRARSMALQDCELCEVVVPPHCMRQEEQLKTLLAWAKEPKLASKCKGQEMTGIQEGQFVESGVV